MAIVAWDEFTEKKVARVYLAGRLREARYAETILTQHGIDYAVEIELFTSYLFGILPTEHEGLAFYVLSDQADFSRQILENAGLTKGLVSEDPESDSPG